ncbi:MAG: hypothetical protein ACRD23_19635 [Terriglobales bacterium]
MNDAPNFLVEWPSRWDEFLTAIGPALGKSPQRLAGEAQTGLVPWWGMLLSCALELLLLVAVIVVPAKLASLQPYEPPPKPKYDIIYYSGNELPRTEDVGGAEAGRSGRSGGREAHHPTQTIRVARGSTLRETVVDAPKLDLPKSNSAVANLLALKALPGPAPAEGMRSSLRAPALPQMAVAPAPQVPDQLRAAPQLNVGAVPPSAAAPQRSVSTLRMPGSHAVQVVPPPVSAPEQVTDRNPRLSMPAPNVVAPPPTMTSEVAPTGPGFGPDELQKQVVPPPVQVGDAAAERRNISGLGSTSVVPPTVQLGAGAARRGLAGGLGTGTAVVPPPPSVSGGGSLTGQGRGNRGVGLGGPLDVGLAAAPPRSNGGGSTSGVVVSSQPGSKVGLPGSGGAGAMAMSPSGGDKAGLGGSGGGGGIGRGNGPGSGFSGPGSGAGKEGTGPGSDPMARGGISPYPGSGGAGTGTSGTPALPGVSVKGGSTNVVTLPSFGSGGKQPRGPGRSDTNPENRGPDITVVATSRSGGAFDFYGKLKGDKVYTIYIETTLGTAVMQFSDPTSAVHAYAEDLTAPQAMRSDLPPGLPKARLVIACVLDRSGLVRRTRVLEPAPAVMTSKVLTALSSWKFRPVLRGNEPIEVNAILGFNIDTNDQF